MVAKLDYNNVRQSLNELLPEQDAWVTQLSEAFLQIRNYYDDRSLERPRVDELKVKGGFLMVELSEGAPEWCTERISDALLTINASCETCSNAALPQNMPGGVVQRLCSHCYNMQIEESDIETSLVLSPVCSPLFVREIHLPAGWRSTVEDEVAWLEKELSQQGSDLSAVQITNILPGPRALKVEFLRDAAADVSQEFVDRIWAATERKCMRCGHEGEKCRGGAYGRHLCGYCASLPRWSGDYG